MEDTYAVSELMISIMVWSSSVFALTIVGMSIRQEMIATKIIALMTSLSGVKETVDITKVMHDHPDDYGFGSAETNKLLKESAEIQKKNSEELRETRRSLKELVHVMRHDIELRTGRPVPPQLPDD